MSEQPPSTAITYRVLLFGPEAAACGKSVVVLPDCSRPLRVVEIKALLAQVEPELARSLHSARIAVNHAFADDTLVVQPDDEIAVINFVSGG